MEPVRFSGGLNTLFVPPLSPIRDAITIIDESNIQLALVIDENYRLVGTVTDGDVRRGLLKGVDLDESVQSIMCRDFHSVLEDSSPKAVETMMTERSVRQVPVLDAKGRLSDIYIHQSIVAAPRTLDHSVVVMAGGEGTRLRPMTDECPKPMLKVGGKPMLEIILEGCVESGFRRFYFSVNYLKQQIKDYFEDGSKWGVQIDYLEEDAPLGTAGAISLIPTKPANPILVINGDVLTKVDFLRLLEFHEKQNLVGTICVGRYETTIPFGVVETEDTIVKSINEKPVLTHHINSGIYLIESSMLDLLEVGVRCDMTDLFERALALNEPLGAFPIHEYWVDIGESKNYFNAVHDW